MKITLVALATMATLFFYLARAPDFLDHVQLESFGDLPLREDEVRPFVIPKMIPLSEQEELRDRLSRARWSDQAPGFAIAGHPYGTSLDAAASLASHWASSFDWEESETVQKLQALSHFETSIGGMRIHFIHQLAEVPEHNRSPCGRRIIRLPLLLLHGWPGSVLEFVDALPLLTRPQCFEGASSVTGACVVFDVVAPSLPGFGWSSAPGRPGLDALAAARVFIELMTRSLGYGQFYVQGVS